VTQSRISNQLGANLTSCFAFELEPTLEGLAAAGYRHVELASIRAIVAHVPLEANAATIDKTSRVGDVGRAAVDPGDYVRAMTSLIKTFVQTMKA
jgi:hypothetical protein